jgi:hypothetical protein
LTKLIIFQVITGIGVGMNLEPPLVAAQAAMTVLDTAVIQSTMTFLRSLATAIAVVLGGVIFQNEMDASSHRLGKVLGEEVAQQFNGDQAAANVELIKLLPRDLQEQVRDAYFDAFKSVWIMVSISVALCFSKSVPNLYISL